MENVRIIQRLIQKDKFLKECAGKAFCQTLLNLATGAVSEDDSLKADLRDSEKVLFDFGNTDDSESENEVFSKITKVSRRSQLSQNILDL